MIRVKVSRIDELRPGSTHLIKVCGLITEFNTRGEAVHCLPNVWNLPTSRLLVYYEMLKTIDQPGIFSF